MQSIARWRLGGLRSIRRCAPPASAHGHLRCRLRRQPGPLRRQRRVRRHRRELPGATSTRTLSWVLNGYAIVFAALLVPLGRLGGPGGPARGLPAGIGAVHRGQRGLRAAPDLGCWSSPASCRPSVRLRSPRPALACCSARSSPGSNAQARSGSGPRAGAAGCRGRARGRRPAGRGLVAVGVPDQHPDRHRFLVAAVRIVPTVRDRRRRRPAGPARRGTAHRPHRRTVPRPGPGTGDWGWTDPSTVASLAVALADRSGVLAAQHAPPGAADRTGAAEGAELRVVERDRAGLHRRLRGRAARRTSCGCKRSGATPPCAPAWRSHRDRCWCRCSRWSARYWRGVWRRAPSPLVGCALWATAPRLMLVCGRPGTALRGPGPARLADRRRRGGVGTADHPAPPRPPTCRRIARPPAAPWSP